MSAVTVQQDAFRGALLGLAIGDALGAAVEFRSPEEFERVTEYRTGTWNLPPGYWTDDTSMALCLAESLVICDGMNLEDQMGRYLRWRDHGYLSSTGECFDIGGTTSAALTRFKLTGNPLQGDNNPLAAGNGCIMRLAPVPLYFSGNMYEAIRNSAQSARTTHGADECIEAAAYFGLLIWQAVNGKSKMEMLYGGADKTVAEALGQMELTTRVREISSRTLGGWHKFTPRICPSGHVLESLEAALWAFFNNHDYEGAVLDAVNLGGDADTVGAICGQLAGAYYGKAGIPERFNRGLVKRLKIQRAADELYRI